MPEGDTNNVTNLQTLLCPPQLSLAWSDLSMEKLVAPAAPVPPVASADLRLAHVPDRESTKQLWDSFSLDPVIFFTLLPPPDYLIKLLHVSGEHLQWDHQQGNSDPSLIHPQRENVFGGAPVMVYYSGQ
ncbi:hypothetical protein WISP_148994 [Willisornis vidua]|uniref:Uncharacterized protein n=1 Tax=Willisornis vidua TaxID=1566151 RepID=A0ABQ9CL44_9PASS|nr:hypothetical protein WISP_148994 [Willisornis vidua]